MSVVEDKMWEENLSVPYVLNRIVSLWRVFYLNDIRQRIQVSMSKPVDNVRRAYGI